MSDRNPGSEPGPSKDGLSSLEQRIAAVREANRPEQRSKADDYKAASLAWRMIIELVVSIMVGAAMGWGLDVLFGTLPVFLIVFVLLGFASGVRMMLRAARDIQRKAAEGSRDERD